VFDKSEVRGPVAKVVDQSMSDCMWGDLKALRRVTIVADMSQRWGRSGRLSNVHKHSCEQ